MNRKLVCTIAILVTAGLSGCDRPAVEHGHEELQQMQLEIEQLTNQVGRLEFRIYELENNIPDTARDTEATEELPTNAENTTASDEPLKTADGQYDLTPVQ
jgi:hypothetical protein